MPRRSDDKDSLTAIGLSRLLAKLDPDAERAAIEYERLRHALVRFFDWRGASPPDECADEVFDRLARRLEEETAVDDVRNYAYGIARLVLLERHRAPAMTPIESVGDVADRAAASPSSENDRLHDCFDRCLAEMPSASRSIVVQYYQGERQAKISNRRGLAAALHLSETALRSRVQRLRDRLEHCVESCVSADVSVTP
jgi:DNA-directed RNA polymerase specialized sigma24 family protein